MQLTDRRSLLARRGVGPESEAESVRFHGRRVTKGGPRSQARAQKAGGPLNEGWRGALRRWRTPGSPRAQGGIVLEDLIFRDTGSQQGQAHRPHGCASQDARATAALFRVEGNPVQLIHGAKCSFKDCGWRTVFSFQPDSS